VQLIIEQAQGLAKVYRRDGRTYMYIAKVTLNGRTVTIAPRRHIPPGELEWLKRACTQGEADEPCDPDKWRHGPDGWVTHVSTVLPARARRLPRRDSHRIQMHRLLCPVSYSQAVPDELELV